MLQHEQSDPQEGINIIHVVLRHAVLKIPDNFTLKLCPCFMHQWDEQELGFAMIITSPSPHVIILTRFCLAMADMSYGSSLRGVGLGAMSHDLRQQLWMHSRRKQQKINM
jgi:hypothetical protein